MGNEKKIRDQLIHELAEIRRQVNELKSSRDAVKPADSQSKNENNANEMTDKADEPLNTVSVPDPFQSIFLNAQDYVKQYFLNKEENPQQGLIEISGERYILVRAASMSKEFFDLVTSLYQDRGEVEARAVAFSFLFDMAHAIGKADAKSFFLKMGVSNPIERLSAGPIHFAYSGWAFVKIFPESNPTPDEDYYLIYDHPFSFEAHTWLKSRKKTDFPVCTMNAGYSSGWCEESFGIPLVSAEIECRAKGDDHCRFIMAPPSRIEKYIKRYSDQSCRKSESFKGSHIPEFFQRKRLEDALRKEKEFNATLIKTSPALFVAIAADGSTLLMNEAMLKALGYTHNEVIGKNYLSTFVPEADRPGLHQIFKNISNYGTTRVNESRMATKDGRDLFVEWHSRHVLKDDGDLDYFFALGIDITERKRAEEELKSHRDHLEELVERRTNKLTSIMEDLRKREAELRAQSLKLEEANIALKVVLKQMAEKKREDKENILTNVKQLVIPYIERVKKSNLNKDQMILIKTLESNLENITSPLISKLSSSFLNLTPMEIRIAHMVKEGLMNKEIAELLGTSLNTVSSHRYKIRTKLGLKNKGANLRSYLLSLDE